MNLSKIWAYPEIETVPQNWQDQPNFEKKTVGLKSGSKTIKYFGVSLKF